MEPNPRFESLRQSANAQIVSAIETLVAEGSGSALCRIDALRFAREHGFPETDTIDAFVHASRLGLFDMSWNLLCPGCGGVLDAAANLKQMKESYNCSLCVVSSISTVCDSRSHEPAA